MTKRKKKEKDGTLRACLVQRLLPTQLALAICTLLLYLPIGNHSILLDCALWQSLLQRATPSLSETHILQNDQGIPKETWLFDKHTYEH